MARNNQSGGKLGYACINMTLQDSKPKITTGRTMRKDTFLKKGISFCSSVTLENIKDLYEIVKWNGHNGIGFYRISSDIVPWASEFKMTDLPDYEEIKGILESIGKYARENGQRLTYHPGPFNVLASPSPDVVKNTVKDLEHHSLMMDLMGLSCSPYNKMNIHIGGVYGNKEEAAKRFCQNFSLLSENCRSRLTIENDDYPNKFSVSDLYHMVHSQIGVPIVFDFHHHIFNEGGLGKKEALSLSFKTWPDDIVPVVHYSESKSIHESNTSVRPQAHSDYIYSLPHTYGMKVDIMLECKAKELALLRVSS